MNLYTPYIYIYASTTTTTTTPLQPLQPLQPPSTYNNLQQQMATALPRISKYYDCGKLHLTVNPDQPSLA